MSSKTLASLKMIKSELEFLNTTIQAVKPQYCECVEMKSMLTIAVENIHAVSHFKSQTQTMLTYAMNLSNTVHEGLKRVTKWAAYYYTHPTSYYPVPDQSMSLEDLTGGGAMLLPLKPTRKLTPNQCEIMLGWANEFGKCVRQKTVRQETTMFKAGTLPLNMYPKNVPTPSAPLVLDVVVHNEEDEPNEGDEEDTISDESENENDDHEEDDYEDVEEYDPDTDNEDQGESDQNNVAKADHDDSSIPKDLYFLQGCITRSGRVIKASFKYT